jgi:predicted nucleic acid-binding Zn ribbon protein|tara:strand:- start:649 stop:807 length:159 start_codon:yes stop_codon:yes gene_type:complete
MPLYEYLCNNPDCDTDTFEVLANYDETIERCPDCKEGTRDRKTFYQFDFHMQ